MPELDPAFLRIPIAHRGLHDRARGCIENSRSAVLAAIEAGYGIEIDIQSAACGEAMVFHDDDLARLTGEAGRVRDYPAEALGRMRLKGSEETIPMLTDILALVAGRAPLFVEIKDQDGGLGPEVGPLEARVAALIEGYDGPVALMSFNPHSVAALADAAPDLPRGLTTCDFRDASWRIDEDRRRALARIEDFDRVGAAFVSHAQRDLANPAVTALRDRGVPILCWTVRSPAEAALARRLSRNITFEGYRPAIDAAAKAAI